MALRWRDRNLFQMKHGRATPELSVDHFHGGDARRGALLWKAACLFLWARSARPETRNRTDDARAALPIDRTSKVLPRRRTVSRRKIPRPKIRSDNWVRESHPGPTRRGSRVRCRS